MAARKRKPSEKGKFFEYRGRNYEDAVNGAIQRAKSEAAYPSSASYRGIKELSGERGLFNIIIKDELKRSKIPKTLITKLTDPAWSGS
ncbi:MAG: hypothetical protein PHW62_00405 [Candidatus Ratteibacteria bacterium]|nr:hypothetical protein [Candidatus Ratteibacteria bacterium]